MDCWQFHLLFCCCCILHFVKQGYIDFVKPSNYLFLMVIISNYKAIANLLMVFFLFDMLYNLFFSSPNRNFMFTFCVFYGCHIMVKQNIEFYYVQKHTNLSISETLKERRSVQNEQEGYEPNMGKWDR